MDYEPIVGMEVHAQVLSTSKMFCGCSADYGSAPANAHVCPVCLGMPGVLPVINRAAVEATVLTGLALGCEVPAYSKFDRKNYTYPDLPKGYQISQYDAPLCVNGTLEIQVEGRTKVVRIRRVHLEEDTAKLMHQGDVSLIDHNRAGVPLMEIVTEADIRSAEEAWQYLSKLRIILRYIGVNTGNMEDGAMRCEANVSVRPIGSDVLGTKVEVKNLNSFRAVRQAIAYEVERQSHALEKGERIEQVTMGWDEDGHRTVFQRSKEYAEDYRYFPEPDLPPLELSHEQVQVIARRLPELPDARRMRFVTDYGLRDEDARLLTDERAAAAYFEAAAAVSAGRIEPRVIANWMTGELFRLVGELGTSLEDLDITPERLVALLTSLQSGEINATVAKQVLDEMAKSGEAAATIIERKGLSQIGDRAVLLDAVQRALDESPQPVQQYLDGKTSVLGFFIGQVMRVTKGQADVQAVRELLAQELAKRGQ